MIPVIFLTQDSKYLMTWALESSPRIGELVTLGHDFYRVADVHHQLNPTANEARLLVYLEPEKDESIKRRKEY